MLFKARHARPTDQADIEPRLDERQRTWLRDTLAQVHPGHAWLDRL